MCNSVWAHVKLEHLDQLALSDPQRTSEEERWRLLHLVLRTNPNLISAMKGVRSLHLPDWCIYGPSIVWPLWSALMGPPQQAGTHQLYVAYYDSAPKADEREVQYLRHLRQILSETPYQVHLSNRARTAVHFSPQDKAEEAPVRCTQDSLLQEPVSTYAVGGRLELDDTLTIIAPLGLSAVFSMRMQRNAEMCLDELFQYKVRRVQAMWPDNNFC